MNELAVVEKDNENAGTLMRRATDAAGVCKEIVMRTAQSIQGRKYVRVEGWQAIANACGCVIGTRDVEKVEGGVRAVGEVRRMSDGAVIATAEGFVGEDEPTWYGGVTANGKTLPARADFAKRAMAQTRAQSRAGRAAFAFVVVLIDGGLSTTPAEEMEAVYADSAPALPSGPINAAPAVAAAKAAVAAKLAPRARPSPMPPEPPPPTDADFEGVPR